MGKLLCLEQKLRAVTKDYFSYIPEESNYLIRNNGKVNTQKIPITKKLDKSTREKA